MVPVRILSVWVVLIAIGGHSIRADNLFPFPSARERQLAAQIERLSAEPALPAPEFAAVIPEPESEVEWPIVDAVFGAASGADCANHERPRTGHLLRLRRHVFNKTYCLRLKHQELCHCLHGDSHYDPLSQQGHWTFQYHNTQWRPFSEPDCCFPSEQGIGDYAEAHPLPTSNLIVVPQPDAPSWLTGENDVLEGPSWDAGPLEETTIISRPVRRDSIAPPNVPRVRASSEPWESAATGAHQPDELIGPTIEQIGGTTFDELASPNPEDIDEDVFELPIPIDDQEAAN